MVAKVNKFWGKYRGKVAGNKPDKDGCIQVKVPSVWGREVIKWAEPCVPLAGPGVGFYVIPPVDAGVWVEFAEGDPNYPILSGYFWYEGEFSKIVEKLGVENEKESENLGAKLLFKIEGITMIMDDGKFSITVDKPVVEQPLKLLMDANGIKLNYDEQAIELTGQVINIVNDENTKLNITPEVIECLTGTIQLKLFSKDKKVELKNGSSSIILSRDQIKIKQGNAVFKLSGRDGIQSIHNSARSQVSNSCINHSLGKANFKLDQSNAELSYASNSFKASPLLATISGILDVGKGGP